MPSTRSERRALLAGLVLPTTLSAVVAAQSGNRHSFPNVQAAPTQDLHLGPLAPSQSLTFGLTLPLHRITDLKVLLGQQKDPKSAQYRKYLSQQEFLNLFGPTQAEYEQVQAFAKAQGFSVVRTFANRQLLTVSGSVQQVNSAFHIHMQSLKSFGEGRVYYAPDTAPSILGAVPILTVEGLSTRTLPKSMLDKTKV